MPVVDRLAAALRGRQVARWERLGGPGPALRFSMAHPWLVTLALALGLMAVFALTFGVPPFSPLVLVLVVVAPVHPVLRIQREAHEQWQTSSGAGREPPGD